MITWFLEASSEMTKKYHDYKYFGKSESHETESSLIT